MNRREIGEALMLIQQTNDATLPAVLDRIASAPLPQAMDTPFSIDNETLKLLKFWDCADLSEYQMHNDDGALPASAVIQLMHDTGTETVGDLWKETA